MRRAVITITWEGPDKKVRDFISDRIDALFFDLDEEVSGVLAADSAIDFTSRVSRS